MILNHYKQDPDAYQLPTYQLTAVLNQKGLNLTNTSQEYIRHSVAKLASTEEHEQTVYVRLFQGTKTQWVGFLEWVVNLKGINWMDNVDDEYT